MLIEGLLQLLSPSPSGFFYVLFSILLSGYLLSLKFAKKKDTLFDKFSGSLTLGLLLYTTLLVIFAIINLAGWFSTPCSGLCLYNNQGIVIEYLHITIQMIATSGILLAVFFTFFSIMRFSKKPLEKLLQFVVATLCILALFVSFYFTTYTPNEFFTKYHPLPVYQCDVNESNMDFVLHNNTQSNQFIREIIYYCDGNDFNSSSCLYKNTIEPDEYLTVSCSLDTNYSICNISDIISGTRKLGYSYLKCG